MLVNLITNAENFSILVVFVAVLYVYFLFAAIRRNKRIRRKMREDLYSAISIGIDNETLVNVKDFINIYKGIFGANDNYRFGLVDSLREYSVREIASLVNDPTLAKKRKEIIDPIIDQIEAEVPFSDLPSSERSLLLDIVRFIKIKDEESATKKIEDLAKLIQVRQDSLSRVQAANKWSIPLAVIGAILTILFGVISIFK